MYLLFTQLQKMMKKLSTLATFFLAQAFVAADVTGDLETWDSIFASRDFQVLVHAQASGLVSTEGPVLTNDGGEDEMLFFSDNNIAKIYLNLLLLILNL